jgi:hypothetical protein
MMKEFVNTHDKLYSSVEIKYTFQCENLSTQQIILQVIMIVYAIVIGCSVGRMFKLKSNGQLSRRHTNLVLVNFMVALTIICALSNTFTYLYGRQCPWTEDLEKAINLLGAARTLLHTIIQAFIVFMTLSVAYGYDVLYADISPRILKLVFGLTTAKFFFFQLERALSGF